jgi:CRISPR/Cas system-associated exonuclease Cas4 (RecB family)
MGYARLLAVTIKLTHYRLEASLDLIASLKNDPKVPPATRLAACDGCSNAEFCWFAR